MLPCDDYSLPTYAGIGSRETPEDICALMRRIGKTMCDMGYKLRSGGALGADTAFHQGARSSERYSEIGVEIFIAWNGMGDMTQDPSEGIWNAAWFNDTAQKALEIATKARGSMEGLKRGGIALQTRNPYQVLGRNLVTPSKSVICYATPKSNGRVSGGTNTAVQVALQHNVPVINLALEAGLERAMTFLKKYET